MKISGSFVDLKQEKDSALFSLLVIDEGDNKERLCNIYIQLSPLAVFKRCSHYEESCCQVST